MKTTVHKNNENLFSPLPVFGQLVSLIQQANVEKIFSKHLSDKWYKRFKTKDHSLTMLIAVITRVQSIRDLCSLIMAHKKQLNQLGLSVFPKRSTLADANKKRSSELFEDSYTHLYKYYFPNISENLKSPFIKSLGKDVKIIDSTENI